MSQTSDANDGHSASGVNSKSAERRVDGGAATEQRGGRGTLEAFREGKRESAVGSNFIRKATVVAYAGSLLIGA